MDAKDYFSFFSLAGTCFYFFFPSGIFIKALVHLIVSHIGAFHSSLQLLLDHPRVTAVAS